MIPSPSVPTPNSVTLLLPADDAQLLVAFSVAGGTSHGPDISMTLLGAPFGLILVSFLLHVYLSAQF